MKKTDLWCDMKNKWLNTKPYVKRVTNCHKINRKAYVMDTLEDIHNYLTESEDDLFDNALEICKANRCFIPDSGDSQD